MLAELNMLPMLTAEKALKTLPAEATESRLRPLPTERTLLLLPIERIEFLLPMERMLLLLFRERKLFLNSGVASSGLASTISCAVSFSSAILSLLAIIKTGGLKHHPVSRLG